MQTQQIDRTNQNAQAGDGAPLRCGNGTIRVLLVDDHPVARAGLRTWLEREEVIDVVDEASDGLAALERIAEAAPDVAVVDLGLPQMDGIETAARIRQSHPATRIILISGLLDAASVRRGLKAGILGFALKTDGAQRLARMVREVYAGEFCCGPDVVGLLGAIERPAVEPSVSLSAREREMVALLASGASLRQAALHMQLTYKSADHLKQTVMKKLHVHDRVALTKFALREGITT